MTFQYAHHRPLTPITPIHSPHPSAGSSVRTRTPGQLSLHEYRKMQVTPSPPAIPGQKTVKKKQGVSNLGRTGSLPAKSPTPTLFSSFMSLSTPPATPSLEPGLDFTSRFSPSNAQSGSRAFQAAVRSTYPEFAHLTSFEPHLQHSPPTSPSLPSLSSPSRPLLSTSPHQPSTPKYHGNRLFSPEKSVLKHSLSGSRSLDRRRSDLNQQSRYVSSLHSDSKHVRVQEPGERRPSSTRSERAPRLKPDTPSTVYRSPSKDLLEFPFPGPLIKDDLLSYLQSSKHHITEPALRVVTSDPVGTTEVNSEEPVVENPIFNSSQLQGLRHSPTVAKPRERHFKPIKHLPRPAPLTFSPIVSDGLYHSDITASTSTFSLSKFPFPKPPVYSQIRYSAPISSVNPEGDKLIPAATPVLRHSDTFFELVNPHDSLRISNILEPPEQDSESESDSDFELFSLPSKPLLKDRDGDESNMNPLRRLRRRSDSSERRRGERRRSVSSPPAAQLYPDAQTARENILSSSQNRGTPPTPLPITPTTPPCAVTGAWTFNGIGQRIDRNGQLITSSIDAGPETHISADLTPTSFRTSRSLPDMFPPRQETEGYISTRARAATFTTPERPMTPNLPDLPDLRVPIPSTAMPPLSPEVNSSPSAPPSLGSPSASLTGLRDAHTGVLFRPRGEEARFRSAPPFGSVAPANATASFGEPRSPTSLPYGSGYQFRNGYGVTGPSGTEPNHAQISLFGAGSHNGVEDLVVAGLSGTQQWPSRNGMEMPPRVLRESPGFRSWASIEEPQRYTFGQSSSMRSSPIDMRERDHIPSYYDDDEFESQSVTGADSSHPPGRAHGNTRYSPASSAFGRTPSFLRRSEPFPFAQFESRGEQTSTISRIIDGYVGEENGQHDGHPLHSHPVNTHYTAEDVEPTTNGHRHRSTNPNEIPVYELETREEIEEAIYELEFTVPVLSRQDSWYLDRDYDLRQRLEELHGPEVYRQFEIAFAAATGHRAAPAQSSSSESDREQRQRQLLHQQEAERREISAHSSPVGGMSSVGDLSHLDEQLNLNTETDGPHAWMSLEGNDDAAPASQELAEIPPEGDASPPRDYGNYQAHSREFSESNSIEHAVPQEPHSPLSHGSPQPPFHHASAQSGPAPRAPLPSLPHHTQAMRVEVPPLFSSRTEASEAASYDDTRKLLGIISGSSIIPAVTVPTGTGGHYWPDCMDPRRVERSEIPRMWKNHSPGLNEDVDTPSSQGTPEIEKAMDDNEEWETEPSASHHNSAYNPYASCGEQNPNDSTCIRDNTFAQPYGEQSPSNMYPTPPNTSPPPITPQDFTDKSTYPGYISNDMLSPEPHDGFEDDSAEPEVTASPSTPIPSQPAPSPQAVSSPGTRFATAEDDVEMGSIPGTPRRKRKSLRASVLGQTSMHHLILPRIFNSPPHLTKKPYDEGEKVCVQEDGREKFLVGFCMLFTFLPFFNLIMGYGGFDRFVGREIQPSYKRLGRYLGWGVFFVIAIVATGVAGALLT